MEKRRAPADQKKSCWSLGMPPQLPQKGVEIRTID